MERQTIDERAFAVSQAMLDSQSVRPFNAALRILYQQLDDAITKVEIYRARLIERCDGDIMAGK